jgi:hypothetical protein
MKRTMLIMFSILAITITLAGQTNRYVYKFKDIRLDTTHSFSITDVHQIIKNNGFNNNTDLFSKNKIEMNLDLDQRLLTFSHRIIKPDIDSQITEEYPGSSKYYAKMPSIYQNTYEKFFIKKPDTTVNYYLIIEDPINCKSRAY